MKVFGLNCHAGPYGRGGGGCDGCARTPPSETEVHFFVDQRFGRLELGTLLKDHDDQHIW